MLRRRLVWLFVALQLAALGVGLLPTMATEVAAATNFTGEWYGRLTQENGPSRPEFYYSLELTQTGSTITGKARIEVIESNGKNFGAMILSGTASGDTLTFTETKIDQDYPESGIGWCLKSATLTNTPTNGQDRLTGRWTAPGCSPGAVTLARAYSLKVTTEGGGSATVTPAANGPDGRAYLPGTVVTIAASAPPSGTIFAGWTLNGQNAGYGNPLQVTMNQKSVVVGKFAVPPTFCDVKSSDLYFEAIRQLAGRNIIRGFEGNGGQLCFAPNREINRAEVSALIARPLGWDLENRGNEFTDKSVTDDNLWRNVGTLKYYKVARGYPDATCIALRLAPPCFVPLDPVNHVQVIALVTRGMVEKGYWQYQPDNAALYPSIAADSGHRIDISTYLYYVPSPLPGTTSTSAAWDAAGKPALRSWFAEVEWRALDSYFKLSR